MKTKRAALGCLTLVVLCLTLLSINAFADIDYSVFTDYRFEINQDDMTGTGGIMFNTTPCYQAYMETNHGIVNSIPAIIVSDGTAMLSIMFSYTANDWCFIKDIIIKAGENRYFFSDVSGNTDVEDGGISEMVILSFGEKSYPLLQYISENQSAEIKIRLDGSESDEDFILEPVVKEALKNLYDGFVLGGGLSQSSSELKSVEEAATAVTVK